MSGYEKLVRTREILLDLLKDLIQAMNFEPELARIKIIFRDGVTLFIRYNNYNEYSYSIIYSPGKFDRVRFDNYDDRWEVPTRPHHAPLRGVREGIESAMIGDPEKDLPILATLIRKQKLWDKSL